VGADPGQVVPALVDDLGKPFRRPKNVELRLSTVLEDHPLRTVDQELDRLFDPPGEGV
jgi:hypothetical protein